MRYLAEHVEFKDICKNLKRMDVYNEVRVTADMEKWLNDTLVSKI